ncbi:hypothetical protein M8C21_021099 [Ambrosia artemisiifolia]|uniref:LOB domain-containing protein n=1 Tax=Ambrosia artemisiifolia TaxID=4212 RepID=A0AAD5CBV4_AMBAR|nr:hypothetical protein M8C21_021099 [Ambrosia artemisiifolia]
MEHCRNTTTVTVAATPAEECNYSHSHSHSPRVSQLSPTSVLSASPPRQPVVLSPCAACKILRRRCTEKCMLAPYFPPTDPHKFTIAHRVFGASNIIKLLQELPEFRRADAVSSMVYEANARLRDPIYGCTGTICQLQKQISVLQAELAKAQAEKVNLQCRQSHILTLIRTQMEQVPHLPLSPSLHPQNHFESLNFFDDSASIGSLDSLWT